jgi:hypothetical protein
LTHSVEGKATVPGLTPPQSLTSQEATLWRVCLSHLDRFLLPDTGILGRKLTWDGQRLQLVTEPSPGNTATVAKALFVLRARGVSCAVDPDALMAALVKHYLSELEYPDVALALWADAVGGGTHSAALWQAFTQRLPKPWQHANVLYLAWAVSALCHVASASPEPVHAESLAHKLYRRLVRHQDRRTGLFHATGQRHGLLRRRDPVASLSVQTFGVQALATYGARFVAPEALRRAEACAKTLCRLQGPMGQFWWIYDVHDGRAVERYPVYTVSQDSIVPAALDELRLATGNARHEPAIARGFDWVFGNNEIAAPLVDEDLGVIWRGLEQRAGTLHVIREMYSYHAGHCLYRLAAPRTRMREVV